MNAYATTDRNVYGAVEQNGLVDARAYHKIERETVRLDDDRLDKVTRLRMITDRDFPFWDVSYCHGVLKDGTEVRVNLPVRQFHKRTVKKDIIEMAKNAGVYAVGLGLLDEGNWSRVYP